MVRTTTIALLAGCLLLAGCTSTVQPTTTSDPTPPGGHVGCGLFGTGGAFLVADGNETVASLQAANSTLRAAQANGSLGEGPTRPDVEDPSRIAFTPVAQTAIPGGQREAIRSEIRSVSRRGQFAADTSLYYFSPDGSSDVHGMAVVTGDGSIYRLFQGAC